VNQPVAIGVETPTRVEIVSGLSAGQQVVVAGGASVQPGETVTSKFAPPAP